MRLRFLLWSCFSRLFVMLVVIVICWLVVSIGVRVGMVMCLRNLVVLFRCMGVVLMVDGVLMVSVSVLSGLDMWVVRLLVWGVGWILWVCWMNSGFFLFCFSVCSCVVIEDCVMLSR